jgi:uncharacterized protein (DUF885 family)
MPEFAQLVDSYFDLKWQMDPVEATCAGVSAQDHRLGAYDAQSISEYLAALKSIAGALEACDVEMLEDEIDRTAVLNDVRVTIHRFEVERRHERDPGFWATHALEGLYLLLALRDRSHEHRASAAAARVKALPQFLEVAAGMLSDCPSVFIDIGVEVARAGAKLVQQVAEELAPEDAAEFLAACAEAEQSLCVFVDLLQTEKREGETADFAIGEDAFNFRLQYEHALRATAPELWRYGHSLIDEVEAELTELAEEIEPGVPWPDLVEKLRGIHPPGHQLAAAYAAEMDRSRRFVDSQGLVDIPVGALEVVETPAFLRPIIPFAAYQPPGAFSDDRTGWFYITPPDKNADPEIAERVLRDHCVHELACTALHEGYPGHHLQFLHAHAQPRVVRKVIGSPVTIEGWALYCEEMMGEAGFYSTLEEKFFQRLALLWRAVRIVADVGLHTRGMSVDEAVKLLVNRVHFDAAHAEAEVRRYCAHPAYQVCYAVGRRELRSLRDAYMEAEGDNYSQSRFHKEVLRYGGLPVSFMRWGMGLGD